MFGKRLLVCFWLLQLGSDHAVFGQSDGTLRIYLARHGETDWNVERRLQGGTDIPLNANGRNQADKLRDRLEGIALDAVYSSTLRRSRDTAQAVDARAPLKSLPGLSERRLGKFEGARLGDRDSAMAVEYKKRARDADDALDGGESWNQFFARVAGALDAIRAQHPSGVILIVGHQATNQMILRALLGLTLEQALSMYQNNGEVYLIEVDREGQTSNFRKLISQTNRGESLVDGN
jgi:2,3-bisphosphoglycerate-dependent phosphoglycerate mutase